MSLTDTVLEHAQTGVKVAEGAHFLGELKHYYEVGKTAVEETQFFEGLSKVEKAKELWEAGKDAYKAGKESGLGKGLDAAGKVIALAETGVEYAEAANALRPSKGGLNNADEAGKHISTGVVGLGIAGTGIAGTAADKLGTMALQAYAKHELERPLTDQEKKDITFKNMAAEGLNATLKPAGEFLGDSAVELHDALNPEHRYQSKPGRLEKLGDAMGQGVWDAQQKVEAKAHEFKETVGAGVDKAEHKAAETLHKVENKAVETVHKVEDKAVELKDKAVDTVEKVADKAVELKDKAVDTVEKVADKAVELKDKVVDKVADTAVAGLNEAKDTVKHGWAALKEAYAHPGEAVKKLEAIAPQGVEVARGGPGL
jgi:dolichyl-phosphate-mannose-protein mannosyltransferase